MIVSGHAQLLRRRLTDPKQLQAIDAVNSAAHRGESLTRQLLAFSRRQPLNPVPIDLRQRVEAMRAMLGSSLRGNINFNRPDICRYLAFELNVPAQRADQHFTNGFDAFT